jgi:hypothetical protein
LDELVDERPRGNGPREVFRSQWLRVSRQLLQVKFLDLVALVSGVLQLSPEPLVLAQHFREQLVRRHRGRVEGRIRVGSHVELQKVGRVVQLTTEFYHTAPRVETPPHGFGGVKSAM